MANSDHLSEVRFKDNVEFMLERFKTDVKMCQAMDSGISKDQLVGIYQAAATLSIADLISYYQEEESK